MPGCANSYNLSTFQTVRKMLGCANSYNLSTFQTVRKMFVNYEDSLQGIILRVSTRDIWLMAEIVDNLKDLKCSYRKR